MWPVLFCLAVVVAVSFLDTAVLSERFSFAYARLATVAASVPLIALTVRRLHDTGWSGWWIMVGLVPALGVLLMLFLMFRKPQYGSNQYDHSDESPLVRIAFAGLSGFLLWLAVAFQTFGIASGSMKPGLLAGDAIAVSSTAFGWPCFGLCGDGDRFATSVPVRGDVVVFRHPVSRLNYVNRVIGLAGDSVMLKDGRVVLNGVAVEQVGRGDFTEIMSMQGPAKVMPRCRSVTPLGGACAKTLLEETMPGGRSYSVVDIMVTGADNTTRFEVPDGMVFVLGDNRDNALDSRFAQAVGGMGFVPVANLAGRATRIVLSNSGFALWDPTGLRGARFWTKIR